ncbi:bifunctional 5,10-methylenetetrahydrofolate dehydrogenase/5,10-methenyltetrahydrofolate cyclohydrolase [Salininema proteolyticum]|uniref:Bifunctional protein FolD n=1 Tax=Salininema proteolyticum TaxID=1607685 RepID=A0ABV8TUD5_9ACTN
MKTIDGRAIAKTIREEAGNRAEKLRSEGVVPTLAVVVPTKDEATAWYVRQIARSADKLDIQCRIVELDDPGRNEVVQALQELSADASVHGIICQTPLPEGVALADVAQHIVRHKDIDGANPESLGRLAAGLGSWAPSTAAASVEILKRTGTELAGKRVAVIGRSTVVGKPAALLLVNESATVTVCHSKTRELARVCQEADILIAAVGRAEMVKNDYIKPGAVVVDVGTNPTADGGLVGDVDFDSAASVAGAVTPVPGGVGPVTTGLLLLHAVEAAEQQL